MPTRWMRRAFASNQVKLFLAGILAAAGVVLAVRGLMPGRSERTDRPKPQIVTADGSSPAMPSRAPAEPSAADFGWIDDQGSTSYEFTRVRNAADARNLADSIGRAVDTSGEATDGLGGDLVGLLAPSIAGEGSVRDAVMALGGEDHPSIPVLDATLQTVLKHASADPSAITVSTPDGPPDAAPGMRINRNRSTTTDADGNEVNRDVVSMTSSFERTFPGASADDATGPLRTVEIPMRSADAEGNEADLRLEVTLRYSTAAQAWQPAAMTIDANDADIVRRIMDAVRQVRDTMPSVERQEGDN